MMTFVTEPLACLMMFTPLAMRLSRQALTLGSELSQTTADAETGVTWILKFAPDAVRNIFSSGLVTGGVAAIVANSVIRIKQ